MTRVCVIRHGPFGSDPRVVKESLALAEREGVVVDVLARGPEPERWIRHPNLRVTTLSVTPASDHPIVLALQALRFGLRALAQVLRARPAFDVIVVHSIPSWLVLLMAPARWRRPRFRLILDHHEPEAEMLREAGVPAAATALYRRVEARSVRAADGVVDVSGPMSERTAGMGARRRLVVDNAPRIFVDPDARRPALRHDLAVFGSLIRRYDLPTLQDALLGLSRPVDLLQVGRGPARLAENPTAGRCRTFDHLAPPDLQIALLTCRFGFVGLAPSSFTDLVSPNRLWELAALGIPSIVARTALTEELLGPFALYYRGGSADSLRETIGTALGMSEADRRSMGQGARNRLRSGFWESQATAFLDFCLAPPQGRVRPNGPDDPPRSLKADRANAENPIVTDRSRRARGAARAPGG